MADRTVYGLTNSENGWRMVDTGSCVWVLVPGSNNVHLQIREGQPAAILGAFVADWNAFIEPVRDADSACWTATNSVASSNHLSGTACDVDWNDHPFQVANAGFNSAQLATMREMLAYYEDMVFWGNDWNSPKDAMHVQMGYDTYGSDNGPKVQDFIARKIRADGFSTFRRGGTVTPPPPLPTSNAADVLARATGITVEKATAILPLVSFALSKGNCTNPRRIAAALAQWVVESGHFVYTEEIADGPETEERWKYKGRTWIQLTWLENYSGFSKWCNSLGLVPTPDYFVVNPHELADQKWAALGPAYWWAIKYPRINEYADRGDIDNVSKWVNAPAWVDNPSKHANGEQARRDAYNQALALGDQLLTLTSSAPIQGDDDLSAEAERMIKELYDEYRKEKQGPSRSFMVPDGNPVDSPLGFLWNIDGNVENINITLGYLFGTTLAEEFVNTVASTGVAPASWAGNVNQAWLQQYGQQWCLGLISFRAAIQKAFKAAGAAPAGVIVQSADPVLTDAFSTDVAAKTASAVGATVRAAVQQAPVPAVVAPVELATTPTDEASNIADLYRSLKSLGLADALPIEGRAPLAALISILQTKNGTQLGATS